MDILRFIKNFKENNPEAIEDCFMNGNCYWFARILKEATEYDVGYFSGYIMYDPVHRKRMRPDLVNAKLNEEETQKKVESNIMNIDIGSRMKDKEIDSSKVNKDNNTTIKKLPKSNYGVVKKLKCITN